MPSSSHRLLLTSIHDVSPRFEGEVDRLLALLAPHVGERLAMLVVPNHWGDAPIVPGSPFATRLRGWAEQGIEIFLHGFYHRDQSAHTDAASRMRARLMTAGEGEFLGLSEDEAASRMAEGRALVEDVIGAAVAGFIAPAWLYGPGALQALKNDRVALAEDHFRVWSPATGEDLAKGPVITWASRTRMRLASSLLAAGALRHLPLRTLRIGVHPPDCRHPALVKSIDKTVSVAVRTRTAGRYSDLLAA